MRSRLLVLAAALALLALALSRESAPTVARVSPPVETGRLVASRGEAPRPVAPTPWPAPARDPFRFLESAPLVAVARPSPKEPRAPVPETSPRQLRLLGFVRRAGILKAAVAVNGDVSLVAVGEVVDGLSVLAIDEDTGVRGRDRDGVERVLTMSPGD